jgi:hypothetical protein
VRVQVHARVAAKRPDLTDEVVVAAFENALRSVARLDTDPLQWVGVGMVSAGRLLEWVAVENEPDGWLIFHAAPATETTLREVGLK